MKSYCPFCNIMLIEDPVRNYCDNMMCNAIFVFNKQERYVLVNFHYDSETTEDVIFNVGSIKEAISKVKKLKVFL